MESKELQQSLEAASDNDWFDKLKPVLLNPASVDLMRSLDVDEQRHVKVFIEMHGTPDFSFKAFLRRVRSGRNKAREVCTSAALKVYIEMMKGPEAVIVSEAEKVEATSVLEDIIIAYREIVEATRNNVRVRAGQDYLLTCARTLEICQRGLHLHLGKPTSRVAMSGIPTLREIIESRKATITKDDVTFVETTITRELTANGDSEP